MSNGKILKVGFAMGGGTSLGTFQGAALGEALKLLILRGVYDDNGTSRRYDRVEVDIFSGASAGSMSLGLMLRTLANPNITRTKREAALKSLTEQFGDAEIQALSRSAKTDLIAAQILLDIQKKVWVEEIDIKNLLADGERPGEELRYTGGVVNRAAVDQIACEYFDFKEGVKINQRILSERVLFASTLSNLTPTIADAKGQFGTHELSDLAFKDGLTSKVHRELRVFDLYFDDQTDNLTGFTEPTKHPQRWFRCHSGSEVEGTLASILERKTWSKIASTCIASGAFPLAFEPVVIERYGFEYGADKNDIPFPKGYKKFPFSYVDGGTFNNEPIREAFRMASFIDGNERAKGDSGSDFDRIIIFADPNVDDTAVTLKVGAHQEYGLADPNFTGKYLDGYDLFRRSSLDRLLPHLGALFSIISNESRTIEGDKIYKVRKKFKTRNCIRELIADMTTTQPSKELINKLIIECKKILQDDGVKQMIPPGLLNVEGEMKRIITEASNSTKTSDFKTVKDKVDQFCEDPNSVTPTDRRILFQILVAVSVDLVMNLEGKMDKAKLIGIVPVDIDSGDIIKLPGGAISGFAGFMSQHAGNHEIKVAQYCARRFLETAQIIKSESNTQLGKQPPFKKSKNYDRFIEESEAGVRLLSNRLSNMIGQSQLPLSKALKILLQSKIKSGLLELLKEEEKLISFEFRIIIPNKRYELDGEGVLPFEKDVSPEIINQKLVLITFAKWNPNTRKWIGPYVKGEGTGARIRIDRDRKILPDTKFCAFRLPTVSMVEEANSHPYPIFTAELKNNDNRSPNKNSLPSSRWNLKKYAVAPLESNLFG
ncbi:MAG: patatin-like phospholipase family protein [Akkermansiaceae bacterium]